MTIHRGRAELDEEELPPERSRRPGGGRKKLRDRDPTLLKDLQALVDPSSRGDPMSPLRWTCRSTRQLAQALVARGHTVSYCSVAALAGTPIKIRFLMRDCRLYAFQFTAVR